MMISKENNTPAKDTGYYKWGYKMPDRDIATVAFKILIRHKSWFMVGNPESKIFLIESESPESESPEATYIQNIL